MSLKYEVFTLVMYYRVINDFHGTTAILNSDQVMYFGFMHFFLEIHVARVPFSPSLKYLCSGRADFQGATPDILDLAKMCIFRLTNLQC